MAQRVTAEQWNAARKASQAAMINKFFEDASASTKGIGNLLNENNSKSKLENLKTKRTEVNDLLQRAENARNYFVNQGNKKMVETVDNTTNFLKNISDNINASLPQKIDITKSSTDWMNPQRNLNDMERQKVLHEQNLYNENKDLSFEDISKKQIQNSIDMNDSNRDSLSRDNQWLEGFKRSKATDEDYKKAVEYSKQRLQELKSDKFKADINIPNRAMARFTKSDADRDLIKREIDTYNRFVNDYSDYAEHGIKNVNQWNKEVEGMDYAQKSKYIAELKENKPQKELENQIGTYKSGKEYLNSLVDGEKATAQGFFDYLENNNKSLYSELNGNPNKEKNKLVGLENKVDEWNKNKDNRDREISYLSDYAKKTANSYEDYKNIADEYQKRIDESTSTAEADKLKHEFASNYEDTYLRLKQENNFNQLSSKEQQEMIDTFRKQYEKSPAKTFNPYDSKSMEETKQYGKDTNLSYAMDKRQELLDRGYSDKEIDSIFAYAKQKINEEEAEKDYSEYYEKGKKVGQIGPGLPGKILGALVSTAESVPQSLASGMGAASTFWTKLKQGFGSETPVDYNSASMRIGQNVNAMREGAKSNYSEVGQFVYDALASTADSVATLPLDSIVPGATTILLGSSAATQSMLDGHNKGLSDAKAIGQGVAAGIFEGLFEKFSLDKVVKETSGVKNIKDFITANLKSMGIEGSEEGFTEIANIVYDQLANGEMSDYNQAISDYKEKGYTDSEAKSKARQDLAVRVSESVAGGVLGGAFMGIPMSGFNYAQNSAYREMSRNGQEIINNNAYEALEKHIINNYDEDSDLYKQMKNTDINDTAQVGYLNGIAAQNEYQKAIESQNSIIYPAMSQRLQELNVPENVANSIANQSALNLTTGNTENINAGKYQKEYEQVQSELFDGLNGKQNNWVSGLDFTERNKYLQNASEIEKMAKKDDTERNAVKSVTKEIKTKLEEKQSRGEITEEGTAHLINDPNEKFTPIELIVGTDGDTQVISNDGRNYKMKDVAADSNVVSMYELGEQYDPEQRKKFFRAYAQSDGMINPVDFSTSFNIAYDYGAKNKGVTSALNNIRINNTLTMDQIAMAYDAGKLEYQKRIEQRKRTETTINDKGSVSFDGVDESRLDDTQKAAVNVARVLSDVTGCKFVFFESEKNNEGKYVGENGSYNRRTNELRVDINAGKITENQGHNMMITTLSHELTHYAENFSKSEYAKLEEFVLDKLAKTTGKDVNHLIQEEIDNQEKNRKAGDKRKITESLAKSELVARGCELMLTDEKAIRELAKRDVGLFGKIKAKVMEFTNNVIKACKEILGKDGNVKSDAASKEARHLQDFAMQMRTLWNAAVSEAAESNTVVSGNVEKQNMLRENYKNEIDEWYRNTTSEERLRDGGRFLIGRTSDVLKSINVKDYNIYFAKSKIEKILNKHHDMNIEFIKQVPEILENPILIMDSVTRSDSLVVLGDLVSKNGEPVIVSLLVDPKNKSGIIQDFGIITSSYGKKLSGLQKIINNSIIRYIEPNEKRTNKWLSALRLQLPSATTKYGSINKITNEYQNVNEILKQDRNTDVTKKAANKLGLSERFLETNLEGRSRESAVQYLKNNSQVKNSFISERGLVVTPILKEPISSYGMNDNIKEFVRENNISYKTLSENSKLREEYAGLIEHSKDDSGKKFLVRRAQDKAQKFIDDMNGAMSGDTEAKEKISREIELAKGKANAYDDGMSMERGQDKLIKDYNKEFEEFISSNINSMYDKAERSKKEFVRNVKYNVKDYVEKAERHFGVTNVYSLAAYIDINGKMLDFSDGGTIRGTDHRGIAEVLDTPEGVSGTDALTAFMNAGNVRIMDTGIDISVKPNDKQKSVLRDYIAFRNGEIYVDFSNEDGSPAGSVQYSKGTSSSRILADINSYFENGKIPVDTYNQMSDFLYQDRNSNDQKLTTQQEEYFKDSKVRDDEGRLMVMYHGTPTGGFTIFKNDLQFFTPNREYASFYEDPSASSRKSGKEKTNPQTYEVYLNIEKPFDIRDKKTRDIFINDYVKGGWALGINPYEEYKDTTKSGLPSWEEADNIYEWLDENDMLDEYDGIVVDEGGFLGENNEVVNRGISYVTFSPNQIKNVVNENPTINEDIRYQDRKISPTTYSIALKDNSNYKAALENLKERYDKAKNHDLSENGAKMLASNLIKNTGSDIDADIIKNKITEVFDKAHKNYWSANKTLKELQQVAAVALNEKSNDQKRTDYAQSILDDIRKLRISLTEAQKAAVEYTTRLTYDEWRKGLMGKTIISKDGTPLDLIWQEYSTLYPDVFKKDVKTANQPVELESILFQLQNEYANNYGFNFNDASMYCATELLSNYTMLSEVRKKSGITTLEGEQYKDSMSAVRREYYQINKEFQKRYAADLNKKRKEWREEQKYREDNLRAKYESMIKQREANIRNREDSVWQTREKEKVRKHIIKTVKSISRMIVNPTNQRHAPEGFKAKTAEFCQEFLKDTSVFKYDDLDRLKVAYEALRTGSNESYSLAGSYDQDIDDMLTTMKNTINGKRLSQLTRVELEQVKDVVDHFNHIIANENKIWMDGKTEELDKLGNKALRELIAKGDKIVRRTKSKGVNNLMDSAAGFMYNNNTPIYFFKQLGPTFESLYSDMRKGQDKWGKNIAKATSFISETKEKYQYDKWDMKKRLKLSDDIQLTVEQAMYLYATAQREARNTVQKAEHLQKGGILFENQITKEGKIFNKVKKQQRAYKVRNTDLVKISNFLTAQQKGYVNSMVGYLSSDMAKLGNETSMQLYGIKKYGESYYFPYKVARSEIATSADSKDKVTPTLKNKSFSKSTTKKANNAIVVGNFSETVAGHISEMCTYNSMAVAQDNINRVYNYKDLKWSDEFKEKIGTGDTIKQVITGVAGEKANTYMDRFLTSVNNGIKADPTENLTNWLISRFKKGAVYASLSVGIQQPSAICRAFALVDPKYFTKTTFTKRDWNECKKYNGVAVIKEIGGFDTGVGQGTVDYLLDNKSDSKLGRAVEKADNALGWLPGWMDQVTWCHIWNAIKEETKDKYNFKGNEAQFYEKASERFDEVINLSQVYDSVLAKSVNMSSKSSQMKSITSFMAEPTVTLNMFMDAVKSKSKKYMTKTISAIAIQTVVNAALKALVQAARNSSDDDKDKSYMEKYAKAFSGDVFGTYGLTGDLSPVTWIPLARDIVSLTEGYDVERTDMSLISDLVKSFMKIPKSIGEDATKTPQDAIKDVSASIAAFLGVPLTNIYRDMKGIQNVYNDIIADNFTPTDHFGRAFLEGIGIKTTKADIINNYIDSGDMNEISDLIKSEKDKIKKTYPGYEKSKVKSQANINIKSQITQQLKKRYFRDPSKKSEIIEFMKNSKLYVSEKKGKKVDTSEKTVTEWIVNQLKKEYLNAGSHDEKKEIRKELWKTGHWKRLRDLDKQLNNWTK